MIKTYATLGPACCEVPTLSAMLRLGLTGFRLNLSHRTLADCRRLGRGVICRCWRENSASYL